MNKLIPHCHNLKHEEYKYRIKISIMAWFHLPHTNCMKFPLLNPVAASYSVHFRVHIPSPGHQMCHCSFAAKQSVSRNKTWKQYCGTQNLITWMWCTLRCTLHYVNVWGPLSVATDTFIQDLWIKRIHNSNRVSLKLFCSFYLHITSYFVNLKFKYTGVKNSINIPRTSIHGWW